jgi:hypothetical protein
LAAVSHERIAHALEKCRPSGNLTAFLNRAGHLAEMMFGHGKYEGTNEKPATLTPWEQEKKKALEERIRLLVTMGQTIDAVELATSEGKLSLPDAKSLIRRLS